MAQILVRDLDEGIVARLKRRARQDGRSLQSEVKVILEEAASAPPVDLAAARRLSARFRRRFRGRPFPDTVKLLREARRQ